MTQVHVVFAHPGERGIAGRAGTAELVLLGGSVLKGNEWASPKQRHLARAEDLGRSI